MKNITLEELLEAGCHFGHQVTVKTPKHEILSSKLEMGSIFIDLKKLKKDLKMQVLLSNNSLKKGGTLLCSAQKNRHKTSERRNKTSAGRRSRRTFPRYTALDWWHTYQFSRVAKNYKKLKDITARLKNDFEKAKYTKKELAIG